MNKDENKELYNYNDEDLDELQKEIDSYNNMLEESKTKKMTRVESNQDIYNEVDDNNKKSRTDNNKEIYEEEEDFLEEKKSNKHTLLITILIILIIIVLAALGFYYFYYKDIINKENNKKYTESEMKEIIHNYGEALENVIDENLQKKKKLLSYKEADALVDFDEDINCKITKVYEDGKVYLNQCKIDKQSTKSSYGKKQETKKDSETEIEEVIDEAVDSVNNAVDTTKNVEEAVKEAEDTAKEVVDNIKDNIQ